jgi:hypothetical protein
MTDLTIQIFPSLRLGNGSRLASNHAGRRVLAIARPTWGTDVSYLVALCLFNSGHWLFAEGVILVIRYFEDVRRTGLDTLAAAIAFVGVNRQKPVP